MAFSEENVGWTITIGDGQRTREPTCRSYNYASSVLNDNLLDIERGNLTSDNIATYHKVGSARRSEGYGNCVFVDGHVAATWGLAGGDPAFNEYATPYQGYEKFW
jgi:prepilin-type processing-associated H-X9-DG protein